MAGHCLTSYQHYIESGKTEKLIAEVIFNNKEKYGMSTKEEKESMLSNEDQFFFGLVITLLIFLLQIPTFDVARVFENFGVSVPSTTGITTQMIVIVLLILSSGSRYVTALIKEEQKRNKWRMVSVTLLLSCIYFEIFDFTIRGLSAFLRGINVFLILFCPIVLSVASLILGFKVERRWIGYYGYRQPINAIIFGSMGITILIAYYLGMLVSLFIPLYDFVVLGILMLSVFITFIVLKFFENLIEKKKKEAGEKKMRKDYSWILSKWLYYTLIAIFLLLLIVFVTYSASLGNDMALRFLPTTFGLLFTFCIFIVFFDLREELEWKTTKERIMKRIGNQLHGVFQNVSSVCEVDFQFDFEKEDFRKYDEKRLQALTTKEIKLNNAWEEEETSRYYGQMFQRLEDALGEIERRHGNFLSPSLQNSLITLEENLRSLSFEYLLTFGTKKDRKKFIVDAVGKAMKEIDEMRKKGIDVGF
jgi:hypothetical protein